MQRSYRAARAASLGSLALVLAACGGGGGGSDSPPPAPPTPLPTTVTITAPAKAQSAGNVAFAPSFAGSNGLTFKWEFGDGTAASADPAPTHQFAKPGDYQVKLTVSDASGTSRNASFDIVVNNQANVRGLVCSGAEDSGWCWSRVVQGNGDPFNDIYFDGQTGWAASDTGALYKSTDGGKTWASKFRLAGERFQRVAFANANRGWALTSSGKLYTSANGGEAWTLQLDAAGSSDAKLIVTDAQRLAVTSGNGAKFSSDGGQSWRSTTAYVSTITKDGVVWSDSSGRSTDYGQSFTAYGPIALASELGVPLEYLGPLSVVNADVAIRQVRRRNFGFPNLIRSAAVALTTDGGVTWSRREIGEDGPRYGLQYPSPTQTSPSETYAATADKLWALDGARVARSLDGGLSWTWLPRGPWPEYTQWFADWIVEDGMPDPDNPDGFSMVVAEGLYGNDGKAVLHTADGGLTWKRYKPDGFARQKAVAAFKRLGPQSLLWQSDNRSAFRTDDDGAHWTMVAGTALGSSAVVRMAFWDDKQGLAVQKNGDLLSTADAGQTWTMLSPSGVLSDYRTPALQIFDNTVWLLRLGVLSVSSDRGKTWTEVKPEPSTVPGHAVPIAMTFFDAKHGIAAMSDRRVLATGDGGVTWTGLGTMPGYSLDDGVMSFSSATAGTLSGLYVTKDGGATWQSSTRPAGALFGTVQFTDGQHGWAAGAKANASPPYEPFEGGIYETNDGGLTWTEKPLPAGTGPLNAIHFQTPQLGWVVGNAGTVLMTRDGGATWTKQDVGPTTRDFTAVYFNTTKTGWLGGSLGEFMATGTGGY